MSEEDIIHEFVNSSNFEIIDNYISKPYIETIEELETKLKKIEKYIENHPDTTLELEINIKNIIYSDRSDEE